MILRHALMLGALALLPAFQSPALAAQTYTLTGDDVAIWDPAGEVRMEAATGNAVEVVVTLQGKDAGDVTVSDKALGSRPTLRVLYSGHTIDRKSTRLNSSHGYISYAVFCLKKKHKIS